MAACVRKGRADVRVVTAVHRAGGSEPCCQGASSPLTQARKGRLVALRSRGTPQTLVNAGSSCWIRGLRAARACEREKRNTATT